MLQLRVKAPPVFVYCTGTWKHVERDAQLHGNLNISLHDVTWSAVFLISTDSKQNHTS